MEAFDAYQHYLSMKLHFERDAYDYFKYNGKTNATFSAFEKRKDGFHFTKLTRKLSDDQIVEYYVANFIRGKKWIGDFDKRNWTQHKKVIQSVEYNFENAEENGIIRPSITPSVFELRNPDRDIYGKVI